MKDRKVAWVGGLLFLLLLVGCASQSSGTQNDQTQPWVMASWSKEIVEQTNLYYADQSGWFEEAGLAFSFVPGAGGGDAIRAILTGQADIAFTDPGSLLFALDKGEKLKVVYNIYPHNVFNLVSPEVAGIQEAADLQGKKVGVYSMSSGTRHQLLFLLHQAGLSEADVTIIETGVANFAPLMQGQVDATAATDTGLADALRKGLSGVSELKLADVVNMPSDLFVVTEQMYEQHPERIRAFLEVYQRSAQWMIDHPEEAAKVAVNTAIDGQDEERNLAIITLRNASSRPHAAMPLGTLDIDQLQQVADLYHELGLVSGPLDMGEAIRTDLLP